jgi:hypothetical protein
MSTAIIIEGRRMRVPGVVLVRMLINLGLDLLMGIVPFLGDVADMFWKANTKNMALLERHAVTAVPPTRGDWLFVGGVVGLVLLMAAVPLLVLYWVLSRFGL